MLRAPDGHAALKVLLRYLLATHKHFDVKKIANLLEKAAGPKVREAIVTELDEIERRGELRGELRGERTGERTGERRGQARMLLKLLTIRFGPVPAEMSAQVMAADQATLSRWAARVLTAPTLETVLAKARAGASKARASASPGAALLGKREREQARPLSACPSSPPPFSSPPLSRLRCPSTLARRRRAAHFRSSSPRDRWGWCGGERERRVRLTPQADPTRRRAWTATSTAGLVRS